MKNKKQTFRSFSEKWKNNKKLAFNTTLDKGSDIYNWILNRNGFAKTSQFKKWVSKKKNILDAGCGNGRVCALFRKYAPKETNITGIDVIDLKIAASNLKNLNVKLEKRDLVKKITNIGKFDLIYCQEVLHHTSNPVGAFRNLTKCLAKNGEIAIYVYKIKAPMREFCDDYIRDRIAKLSYKEAMLKMKQITQFGKALSNLNLNVKVPTVDLLGIKAGQYDLQRFIYHFFAKCFWSKEIDFNSNAAINFDWYHPTLCTRHTLKEVEGWFKQSKLKIIHKSEDHYGITVRGKKVK